MSRIFNLFSSINLTTHESSTSLSELDQVASLKEALEGLHLLMNDDLNGVLMLPIVMLNLLDAEKTLVNGSSAFHKTGYAAVSFLRALIGFEKELMKEGISQIRP
jgi:Protein of unknown function (DUF3808)